MGLFKKDLLKTFFKKDLFKLFKVMSKKDLPKTILKALLLFGVLVFIFFIVYKPHLDYIFPIHSDEWQHLALATRIIDDRQNPVNFNPYSKELLPTYDLEIGFHVFLAEFFSLTGLDSVLSYKFLAAFFACVAAFALFVLVYSHFNDFFAGVFAMLFFASLKSNVNILGLWFFVPLTLAIPLIYILFFTLTKGLEEENVKLLFISALVMLAILIIHPISATFAVPIILIYSLFKYKTIIKKFDSISPLVFVPLLAVIIFFAFLWKGSIIASVKYLLDLATFGSYSTYEDLRYLITTFYGGGSFLSFPVLEYVVKLSIGTLLALIAVPIALYRKKRLFVIWLLVTLVCILIFSRYNMSPLAEYRRMIYYTFLALAPLSAFALSSIIRFPFELSKKFLPKFYRRLMPVLIIVSIIFAAFVFSKTYEGYYDVRPGAKLYKVVSVQDYSAVKFIEKSYGKDNIILALPHISSAVYPISRNHVVAI